MIDLTNWVPSGVIAALLVFAAWIGLPRILAGSIERAVQHKLDEKLERVRSEIRSTETSIEALRTGALTGIAARQGALDARRLLAAERLWAAVIAMHPSKSLALMAGSIKLDAVLTGAEGTSSAARRMQQFADTMLKSMIPDGFQYNPAPDLERPFLSPQAWALFVAYRLVITHPVMIFTLAKAGLGSELLKTDPSESIAILKAALPSHSDYLDRYGLGALHLLVPIIEERLLKQLDADIRGVETSAASVEAALQVIRLAETAHAGRNQTPPVPESVQVSEPEASAAEAASKLSSNR